ncbi:MAG: PAS domain S-box protein [Nitrospira sp.]|nr:PAS domain S-box protein [Nitrospira sp.]
MRLPLPGSRWEIRPWLTVNGSVGGIIIFSEDITERKQAEAVRARQYESLQAIFHMTVALSRASTLEDIYEQGIDGVQQALKVDRASILLFDDAGVMKYKASRGLSKEYIQAVEGHSPWTREAINPPPKSVADIEDDPYTEAYRGVFRAERIRAMSFIPLWSSDGLLGKFMLYYDTSHQFTDEELQVSQTIAGHIAFMIQRKRAEEALLISQERYARATVVGKVGVWELDVLQEQFHADDNLKALCGYSKDELSTDPFIWLNLVHPDDRAITLESWNQVSTGLIDSYSYEVRMIRKDGSIIWTHVRGQANRNDAGAIVRLTGATVDVTDRKRADERVLLTQFSIDRASDAVLWMDSSARIFNVNDAACHLLNYAREELITLSLYDLDPNVSTEEWGRHWEQLKQKGTVTVESSYWSSSGRVVETEITSNYLQYGGKEYDCAIVRDITERKQADAALRLAKFSMERAADAVYWIDPQARVLDVNDAASLMLGYSKDELRAMTVHDLNPDFPAALWPGFWADTKQRGTMVLETAHRAKDGRLIPIEVSINYLAYEGQEYHCAFVRDITERKRVEQEVNERILQTLKMQAALLRLTHLDETGVTLSEVLPRLCEIVAETLGVARVSVWLLSETRTELVCQNLYDRMHATHSIGSRHSTSQYLRYLKEIEASLVVAAPDACADPRTSEFVEHYFRPLGITSMLDVPIRRQGVLVGVLWLEHVGVPRDWSPEAQSFGASLGEILGRMMETTERTRAESDLRQSHTFMRQVIDTDPNFIFAKDREGRFTLVNQAIAEAYGTTVEDLIGKTDADFNLSQQEVEAFRQKDLEVMDSLQEQFISEEKITDAHGNVRWLQTVKRPLLNEQNQAVLVLGAATDITARKYVEERLRQRERDLRTAIEDRERISEDLHDGILQSIFAVGLGLESCRTLVAKLPLPRKAAAAPLTATLNSAIGQLNHVMTDVRNFIAGIESQVLQGGKVDSTLRAMVQAMCASYGMAFRVTIESGAVQELSTEQAYHVMNLIREALSNSLRHSEAGRITVSFKRLRRSLRLSVSDNGKGFTLDAVHDIGHGLTNMAARAQKLGAQIDIRSQPRQGTNVRLDIPRRLADE